MSLEILFDTVLGLSPYDLQILFWAFGCVPCHLVSASTLLISAIHFVIPVISKKSNFLVRMHASTMVPQGGRFGLFLLVLSCVRTSRLPCHLQVTRLIDLFLQVEDDVESYQMPKRSRRDDLAKAMVGGLGDKAKIKPKSSNTAPAAAASTSKGKGKGRGMPINIPLDNISPELKKILVQEMVKGGRAKVVKKSKVEGQGK